MTDNRPPRAQRDPAAYKTSLHDRIDRDLTYYPATSDQQREDHEAVRAAAREFSHQIIDLCPAGRHLSLALTHIEDAMHQSNHAVAQGE